MNQGRVQGMNHGGGYKGVRESGQGSQHESWGGCKGGCVNQGRVQGMNHGDDARGA